MDAESVVLEFHEPDDHEWVSVHQNFMCAIETVYGHVLLKKQENTRSVQVFAIASGDQKTGVELKHAIKEFFEGEGVDWITFHGSVNKAAQMLVEYLQKPKKLKGSGFSV